MYHKRPMSHIAHLKSKTSSWTSLSFVTLACFRKKEQVSTYIVYLVKLFFSKWSMFFHYFAFISPSSKDALCHVWLKLAQWFWTRRILKVVNFFLLFPNYLPLGMGMALHLNKLEYPSPKDNISKHSCYIKHSVKYIT